MHVAKSQWNGWECRSKNNHRGGIGPVAPHNSQLGLARNQSELNLQTYLWLGLSMLIVVLRQPKVPVHSDMIYLTAALFQFPKWRRVGDVFHVCHCFVLILTNGYNSWRSMSVIKLWSSSRYAVVLKHWSINEWVCPISNNRSSTDLKTLHKIKNAR